MTAMKVSAVKTKTISALSSASAPNDIDSLVAAFIQTTKEQKLERVLFSSAAQGSNTLLSCMIVYTTG